MKVKAMTAVGAFGDDDYDFKGELVVEGKGD